jgi:hypothetical protein
LYVRNKLSFFFLQALNLNEVQLLGGMNSCTWWAALLLRWWSAHYSNECHLHFCKSESELKSPWYPT